MSEREKKLGLGVLLVVLLWGGRLGWTKYQDTLDAKRAVRNAAQQEAADVKLELAKAKYAAEQVTRWEDQSLPRNKTLAQSEYQTWLVNLLDETKLRFKDVRPTGTASRSKSFEGLAFTVEAEGDLPAVVRFLHAFYSSNVLHKITRLHLRPASQANNLSVSLNVEALSMPTAPRTSGMPEGTNDRLASAELDHYLERIVSRNPFVPYKPKPKAVVVQEKPREKPAEPPPFDESTQAVLTGIVSVGDELQAWVNVRTSNQNLRLLAGDEFEVGQLAGKVVEIQLRNMVIEIDGKRQRLTVGDSLRDGIADSGGS